MTELYEIPFVVGITGHRDPLPSQLPAIRATLTSLLRRLKDAHPDVRIQLLCSVADGADLLAADVAMELGIQIVALLTFPEDVCRGDLLSDEARSLFDRVMAGAERLEVPLLPGVTRESLDDSGPQRDAQYQHAALLLARYCSLLIAIWDGKPTPHAAGSARVVEFRRRGIRLSQRQKDDLQLTDALLSARDNDLLFDIRCARASDPAAVQAQPALEVPGFSGADIESPGRFESHLPRALTRLLARTAGFNADSRRAAARIATNGYPLIPPDRQSVPPTLQVLNQLFVQADYLGSWFRQRLLGAIKLRYTLWAVMAALLIAFEHFSTGASGLALILVVIAIFTLGWMHARTAHRRSWHRKYLDYRALAEALRVDYFWELSGVRQRYPGEFAHESFLQKQDTDLEWIRAAMRAVSLRAVVSPNSASPGGMTEVIASWIGDDTAAGRNGQVHYYGARSRQMGHRLHRAEYTDRALLGFGLGLTLTFLLDILLSLNGHHFLHHLLREVMLVALPLLTVYAGIYEVYLNERGDHTLVRQYRYMYALFGHAAREMQLAPTAEEKLQVLRSLGHACLTEHAQWTLAQRDKAIQGLKW